MFMYNRLNRDIQKICFIATIGSNMENLGKYQRWLCPETSCFEPPRSWVQFPVKVNFEFPDLLP